MLRRSAPPSSRCVAKLWRSACGERALADARRARSTCAAAAARRSVPSGRPVLLRNSASVERRPRALAGACAGACAASAGRARSRYALTARHRGLADGHEARLAALALHAQLLAVVVDVARPQRHELLGAQAARVGELEHRAVAQLQRARRRGSPSSSRAASRALSTRGRCAAAPGRGHEIGGVLGDRARARAGSRTARAARPACAREVLGAAPPALGEVRDVAAHGLRRRRPPARGPARPPSARTGARSTRVRAARARAPRRAAQVLVEQRDRLAPTRSRSCPSLDASARLGPHVPACFAARARAPACAGAAHCAVPCLEYIHDCREHRFARPHGARACPAGEAAAVRARAGARAWLDVDWRDAPALGDRRRPAGQHDRARPERARAGAAARVRARPVRLLAELARAAARARAPSTAWSRSTCPASATRRCPPSRSRSPATRACSTACSAELGIDAAAVVGNSMGGFIAAELAIAFPQRVERLVLDLRRRHLHHRQPRARRARCRRCAAWSGSLAASGALDRLQIRHRRPSRAPARARS